jgi:choline-sulfatase
VSARKRRTKRSRGRRAPAVVACAALILAVATIAWFLRDPSAKATTVATRSTRPNILLITLDTVRADRLGAYGYSRASTPVLDRLAREGVLFADATTQSPLTTPAHAALFTGVYPGRLGVKSNASTALPDSATTMAERFADAGYQTAAFIGAFILDRQFGFGQGFQQFDATFDAHRAGDRSRVQRTADAVAIPAVAWLRQSSRDRPFFIWVHFYDAHAPYQPPANAGPADPYDGEIAWMDRAIGTLLDAIGPERLRETIVVAVGDHGEALGDHGEEDHGIFLYEAVLHIPWIMRLPANERAGLVVSEQVRSVDLMPTLLDLAGVPGVPNVDGESLTAVIRGTARPRPPASYAETHYPSLHFGWSMLRSLRAGEWKYIEAPRPELYNLPTDRAESHNLLAERGRIADGMAAEAASIARSFGAAAKAAAQQPDLETAARLRSLGYVGLRSPSAQPGSGADPKDKIAELNRFRTLLGDANADLAGQRTDAALAKLQQALKISDGAYDLHVILGDAWRQKGRMDRALGEYDAAAVLNPETAAPHLLAADLHIAQREFDRAMARVERAAAIEPRSSEVARTRGRVLEYSGRAEQALAQYEQTLAIDPSDVAARARLVSVAMGLRRFDLAEPHLRYLETIQYQPARTYHGLGVVAESRGDFARAAAEFRRALAVDPAFPPAREALARVSRQ